MLRAKAFGIIISFAAFLFLNTGISYAIDDSFGSAKRLETKYFGLYYASQLDVLILSRRLNMGAADEILVGRPPRSSFSTEAELADMLDTLFLEVCDILDMHLYSFQGNIKVARDRQQLNGIYYNLFDKNLEGVSFYVYDLNTIYVSQEDFKREILGHEIAHAVISRYFVVSPSVKIQEILAGYTEYQLRKARR